MPGQQVGKTRSGPPAKPFSRWWSRSTISACMGLRLVNGVPEADPRVLAVHSRA